MTNITFPIVIFDRHHLLFFLSQAHAVHYIQQSSEDQLSIFDSNGQVLSYQADDKTHSHRRKLVLMDNVFISKEILLAKFRCLLEVFNAYQTLSENVSVHQLILLVYRLF
ncbi:MAG: hypothetical protein AB4041_12055 [Microcystaceae cyanobacterium]